MNKLVDTFQPVLNFLTFAEKYDDWFHLSTYAATSDNNWSLVANFDDENKTVDDQYYYPRLEFEKNRLQNDPKYKGVKKPPTEEEKKENRLQAEKIIEHMQAVYNPNFERAIEIIKIFLQQGLNTGIYNNVKVIPHSGHIRAQFYRYENNYNGYNRLFFDSKVVAKIVFNNLLQTLRAGEKKFKNSHLTIDIIYLVSKDNTLNPYFKIRLPYSSHKKINCILSFDCSKMYFVSEDSDLKKDFIDNLEQHLTDNEYLEQLFRGNFKKEIIRVITKTLKIKRADLIKLSEEELKSYFILIEMVKL
jgi:hypothetical protein